MTSELGITLSSTGVEVSAKVIVTVDKTASKHTQVAIHPSGNLASFDATVSHWDNKGHREHDAPIRVVGGNDGKLHATSVLIENT